MSRKQFSLKQRLMVATALGLGASGVALADDNSMSRFGGESYAYFNRQPIDKLQSTWRQANPKGLSEVELQALSSSDLSAVTARLNPPVLASAPADPTWRVSHPNGFTERELQALSASSMAVWEARDRVMKNVAQRPGNEIVSARLTKSLNAGSRTQAGTDQ